MLIFLKSVRPFISYDVICVKILQLNNLSRFYPFGQQIAASGRPWHRLRACQNVLQLP